MTFLTLSDISGINKDDLEQRITNISKQLIGQLSQRNGIFSCDSFGTLFLNSREERGKQLFEKIATKAQELTTNSNKPIIYIPTSSFSNQGEGIKRVIENFEARKEGDEFRINMQPWIDALNTDFRTVYMSEEEFDDDTDLFSETQGFITRETYLGYEESTLSALLKELMRKAQVSFHPIYDFSGLNKEDFKKRYYSTMLQWDGSALVDKYFIEDEEVLKFGGEYKIRDLMPQRQIQL